jgi:hypothetical protein
VAKEPFGWPFGKRTKDAARKNLRELIAQERKRAQLHIQLIRQTEPTASNDRIAHLMVDRWSKVAAVEGGITGALGILGVPVNFILFAYFQLALIVSVAEAYHVSLEGEQGEDAVLYVLGRVHGIEDLVRAGPRVLGALAKALAIKHGLGTLGRLVPMIAAPISAKLNEREMNQVGNEAMRRFGNVVQLGPG